MSHSIASQTFSHSFVPRQGLQRFVAEVREFFAAILNPGALIAEVHQMRELQLEAGRVEATDPQRARVLRQKAARIGVLR
jgi:hypothetical protein